MWRSTRSGEYEITGAAKIGVEYSFRERGADPKAEPLGKLQADGFSMIRRSPTWFGYGHPPREPKLLVQFNGAVDPVAVMGQIYFQSEDGRQIGANVRQARGEDFKEFGVSASRTLRERWLDVAVGDVAKDEARKNALFVTVVEPLPVGDDWELVLAEDLPGPAGSELGGREEFRIGSIQHLRVPGLRAYRPYDFDPTIRVRFNKELAEGTDLKGKIHIDPEPRRVWDRPRKRARATGGSDGPSLRPARNTRSTLAMTSRRRTVPPWRARTRSPR